MSTFVLQSETVKQAREKKEYCWYVGVLNMKYVATNYVGRLDILLKCMNICLKNEYLLMNLVRSCHSKCKTITG